MKITDYFTLEYLQELQDLFSDASGVASIITTPEGTPVTKPSNFCVLCNEIIRKTPKGLENCKLSDAELGKQNLKGPIVRPCLSGGLWDAGVSINVNGKHLANWLIGQVRSEGQNIEKMLKYADEIGADRKEFLNALKKVPVMSVKQFENIAKMLFQFVNHLTEKVHTNLLLKEALEKYEKNTKDLALEQVLLNALMDNYPDNIYFKDRESRFIRSNLAQLKRFELDDYSRIKGKTDFDFFTEEHAREAFNDEQEIIGKGITISKEEKETWPNQADSWVSTTKAPLFNSKGEIIGTFGISRDITEKKMYENLINQQNDELKKLNAQKDKLFSIIAHDLRSPFNSFLGLTEVLEKEIQTLTEDQILVLVRNMKSSASRLYTLLSNLLEWSRLQRGMIKPKIESFSLFDVFDECFLVTSDMATQKQIKIINKVPVGMYVNADKNMVQIVVHNLLTNALKFTPTGGKIEVFTSISDDDFISVTIKDTGIGMSKKLLDDLFRIDKKTNRPGTNNEPSSGLGLIICNEFLEKNGGKISVESEEGSGTSFTFTLPSAE